MENIFGIIIFILFIALRTVGDRKRGMNKKNDPQKPKEIAPTRAATAKKQVAPKKVIQQYIPKPIEPLVISEGESYYDGFAEPMTYSLDERQTENPEDYGQYTEPSYGLVAADLRQAIIWSEIIDKPRFKKRSIN